MSSEEKDRNIEQDILNIENLRVRFETEDGVVHAVNGIDLKQLLLPCSVLFQIHQESLSATAWR